MHDRQEVRYMYSTFSGFCCDLEMPFDAIPIPTDSLGSHPPKSSAALVFILTILTNEYLNISIPSDFHQSSFLSIESDTGNTTNFVTLRPIKGKRYVMWPPIQCPPREPMMKLRLHPHQNGVCSNWWLYYTYADHSRPINEETRYDMLSPNRNESRSFTVIETINKSKYSTKKDMTRKSASEVVL